MSEEKEQEEEIKTEDEQQVEGMREKIRMQEDKYVRLLAETENRTKRMQKEKQDMMRFATQNAISEFLPVLDNFEAALGFTDQMSDETKNWVVGFEMILSQLKEVVSGHGFVAFQAEGMFDPHLHEALEVEETDEHPDGTILKQFQRGYKCGARVVVPARVKVAKNKSEEKKEDEQEK